LTFFFLRPVVDDDAPRSLQVYLQRTSTITAGFSFAGSVTTFSGAGPGNPKVTFLEPSPSVDADVYIVPAFAITARFAYAYDILNFSGFGFPGSEQDHRLIPEAGVALRLGDTRLDLSFTFEGDLSSGRGLNTLPPPRWGTIEVDLQTVLNRRLLIKFGSQVFDAGAGSSAMSEYFLNKDFGIFVGGFGYVGRSYYNEDLHHNDYGAFAGVGWWLAPRLLVALQYELAGTTVPRQAATAGTSQVTNEIDARLVLRLP
jgi:hypothetical protein